MKVRDLQFAKYFLSQEQPVNPEVLDKELVFTKTNEPNSIVDRGSSLLCGPHYSIGSFLHNLIYRLSIESVKEEGKRDAFSLALMKAIHDYIYTDYDESKKSDTPVVLSFSKLSLPAFILHDLVEPVAGPVDPPKILYAFCPFTDAARIITDASELQCVKGVPPSVFKNQPLVLANSGIYNHAASLNHVFALVLESEFGTVKSKEILKTVLLDKHGPALQQIVNIVKLLYGDVDLLINFLRYLESNAEMTPEECQQSTESQLQAIGNDSYLKEQFAERYPQVKIGGPMAFDAPTFKQWSQFSMLMGLTEKQLDRDRGSSFPTTEKLKPHEDSKRKTLSDEAARKGKTQLNMEEMLEQSRKWYNHKAVLPGQLHEKLLTENRVWKA